MVFRIQTFYFLRYFQDTRRKQPFSLLNLKVNQENFEELFELLEAGKINPRIKDKFKLEDSAKAIAHLAERKATGKVIVEIA